MTKLLKKLFGRQKVEPANRATKVKAGVDRAVKEYRDTFDKLVEYDRAHTKMK